MFLDVSAGSLVLISFVATIMSFAVAIPFHEFAHAFAAKREGDYTAVVMRRYTLAAHAHFDLKGFLCLFFFGFGWAKPVPVDSRNFKRGQKSEFFVSIAGVLANLILGTIFLFFYLLFEKCPLTFLPKELSLLVYYFLNVSVYVNFMLAFFNLLPIYPLDGYNLIKSLSKEDNGFLVFMRKYSIFIYFLFLWPGLFSTIFQNTMGYVIDGLYKLFSLVLGL